MITFLDPEGGSQKATLVVLVLLVLGISSLRVRKSLRLSYYAAECNETLHTHSCYIAHRATVSFFHLFSN